MKNILIVSPTGGYAGIDACLDTLVCGLDRSHYNPIVVFPLEATLKPKFEKKGILCYELPLKWWFPIGVSGNDLLRILDNSKNTIDPLVHIIKDNSVDIVISNTSANFDGAFAAAICDVPHVFYIHAQYVSNIYVNMSQETKEFLYSFMGKFSCKLVCCSKLLHEYLTQFADNSTFIFNGVDTEKFKYQKRTLDQNTRLDMVTVGHYNANKQQDFVITALNIIKEMRPDLINRITYTMIGPGESGYKQELMELVAKYKLGKRVVFEEFRDDIHTYLNKFNIYINSSISENLPVSVLEAMSSGMPVLGTPNDGILQLVQDGVTGYITKTPEEMADRIINILENEDIVETMSEHNRKRIESNFTERHFINGFENLLEQIDSSSSLGKEFAELINNFYESIVRKPLSGYHYLKVLVIYPPQAMATYYIGAKNPLDYLKEFGALEYKSVTPQEYTSIDFDNADIIFCIRYYDDFVFNILKKAKECNKPFVWLIDDNYSALKFENNRRIDVEYSNTLYERMYIESDAVLVNSGNLFHFGNRFSTNIYRLPTYQIDNTALIPKDNKENNTVKIGFMGTLLRDGDFESVVPALKRIIDEYDDHVCIEFIGYYPEELKSYKQVRIMDFIPDYNQFREFFASRNWDIGLGPLSDTEFNRSKTNNKYREYSSFRIAGIFSNIATYNYCINDGINGLLVDNTADSWYHAIKRLIEDPHLRRIISENALQDIRNNYNIKEFAKILLDVFDTHYAMPIQTHTAAPVAFSSRVYDPEMLSYSKPIVKPRKYRVFCEPGQFSKIGFLFAQETPCKGVVTINIYIGKHLFRCCTKQIENINFTAWDYFSFKSIQKTEWSTVTVEIIPKIIKGTLGVYEDRRKRSFIYKIFNRLGMPLKGFDTLMVDFIE